MSIPEAKEFPITELLDFQPDSVLWLEPVFEAAASGQRNPVDFILRYCNRAAAQLLDVSAPEVAGVRLSSAGFIPEAEKQHLFARCCQVWERGTPVDSTDYHTGLDRYYSVRYSKVQNGIFTVGREITDGVKAELKKQEQQQRYQQMLDTSADGVLLLESIRDEQNRIVDFRIAYCNKNGFESGQLPLNAVGKTVFELFPHMREGDQLQLHRQVVETGTPVRIETAFSTPQGKEYGWFMVSLSKLGDGVVSRFTDITQRKLHEQEIEAQRDLLSRSFEASLSAVVIFEAVRNGSGSIVDFRYVQVNRQYLALRGKKEAEVLGNTMLALFPTTRKAGVYGQLCTVLETGNPSRFEVYYQGEGIDSWYDVSVVKISDDRVFLTFGDISDQKKALLEVEQQKNLLDNILKNSSNGISVTKAVRDEQGTIIDAWTILANDAAVRFTGLPREIYLSKSAVELDPNIISSPYYHAYRNTLETGEPAVLQYFLEHTGRWLDLTISRMDADHVIHIFTDVTTFKKAQLATEQAAEKLRTVFNTSQAGFFLGSPVLDAGGTIVDFRFTLVNQVLASFVGREPAQLVGELASDWFVQYKLNGLFDRFRDTYVSGEKQVFDFHYRGEEVDVWANVVVTRLDDELLGSFTDFTLLKNLQLQLERSVTELKRSNANLEEFAYAASHDLKEPIRKIHFFADRLKEQYGAKLDESGLNIINRLGVATGRMKLLVDDLLTYSQVSIKPREPESVDLNEKLGLVITDLELEIESKNATIDLGQLPVVKGYGRQLQQLFQNLVGNALKYSRQDAPPLIAVRACLVLGAESGYDLPADAADRQYHLIEVQDNGIGFEQKDAERIFNVFTRLHGNAEYSGTGVGLSITRKVVENHGGAIWAESEPSRGATFKVLLPAW